MEKSNGVTFTVSVSNFCYFYSADFIILQCYSTLLLLLLLSADFL